MYNITNWSAYKETLLSGTVGGIIGGLVATLIILALIILIALYVYFASAWYAIAKKRGHKHPWLAWIPIANMAMWLQMGGFHWAWIFLIVIPIAGWIAIAVLFIISTWRVFEKLRYPGWWSLALLLNGFGFGLGTILYGIAVGVVAWKKK
jgi:hypothetical protein